MKCGGQIKADEQIELGQIQLAEGIQRPISANTETTKITLLFMTSYVALTTNTSH